VPSPRRICGFKSANAAGQKKNPPPGGFFDNIVFIFYLFSYLSKPPGLLSNKSKLNNKVAKRFELIFLINDVFIL
ncbi:MAG: hypothetical protein ABSF55_02315, partial [Candidatus Staskawiczbacteria bacterium]